MVFVPEEAGGARREWGADLRAGSGVGGGDDSDRQQVVAA